MGKRTTKIIKIILILVVIALITKQVYGSETPFSTSLTITHVFFPEKTNGGNTRDREEPEFTFFKEQTFRIPIISMITTIDEAIIQENRFVSQVDMENCQVNVKTIGYKDTITCEVLDKVLIIRTDIEDKTFFLKTIQGEITVINGRLTETIPFKIQITNFQVFFTTKKPLQLPKPLTAVEMELEEDEIQQIDRESISNIFFETENKNIVGIRVIPLLLIIFIIIITRRRNQTIVVVKRR